MADYYDDEPVESREVQHEDDYDERAQSFEGENFAAEPHGNGALPEEDFGPASNGNPLPAPEDMEPEESIILREWQQKRAEELEEKEAQERAKKEELLELAAEQRETFYLQRDKQVEAARSNNRDKEQLFLSNLDTLSRKAESNYWEAVGAYVNFDTKPDKKKAGKDATPRPSIVPEVKAGRATDLVRFRQILLKLKHTPPIKA